MLSWIAGIDYSTHAIDVVLIDENDVEAPVWHRTELGGADAFERARQVRDNRIRQEWFLPPFMSWDDVLAVGIEDPRGQNAGALYRIQGAILARLQLGLLVQPWIPSQWRKAVGLPGNASKQDVWSYVTFQGDAGRATDGAFTWPQDACDAYCIALATRQAITRVAAA